MFLPSQFCLSQQMSDKVFQIQAGFQTYAWGKPGLSSSVAQFAKATTPSLEISSSTPYAELWMGTHPKVPSYNIETKQTLREIINSDPEKYLGSQVIEKFGSAEELPFLFKVLSIEKVLSIQAHPDKELARKLHVADPKNYPDDNHKPEMAIAVTLFTGFCGFKPLEDIALLLASVPEFYTVVGKEVSEEFSKNIVSGASEGSPEDQANRKLLQKVFSQVMHASDETIAKEAAALAARAEKEPGSFPPKLAGLIVRLNKQFPNDVGLFCGCMMLNYVELSPGEAVFLKAKDPHAYISGDIIECMAASDNVVRAGFTPKFKDVENLVSMLTYLYESVEKQKMKKEGFSRAQGGEVVLYDPPIAEFAVLMIKPGKEVVKTAGIDGPSLVIFTEGEGVLKGDGAEIPVEAGTVVFVAPKVEVEVKGDNVVGYRAFVE